MAIVYQREVITNKAGQGIICITAKDFDYKKDSKKLYAHDFRYFNAKYNEAAGREAVATFGIREEILKEKYPKWYEGIMKVAVDLVPKKAGKKADKTTKKADKAATKPATKQTTNQATKTTEPKEPTLADIFAEFKAMRAELDNLKAAVGKGAC